MWSHYASLCIKIICVQSLRPRLSTPYLFLIRYGYHHPAFAEVVMLRTREDRTMAKP